MSMSWCDQTVLATADRLLYTPLLASLPVRSKSFGSIEHIVNSQAINTHANVHIFALLMVFTLLFPGMRTSSSCAEEVHEP